MLRSRRAYAENLKDWRLNESASSVDGFHTYIEPKTQEAIESMIQELMNNEERETSTQNKK
jgi:surfactin synthase thioesterase subunit